MNFFPKNPDKFIVTGASEVSLYELCDRDIEKSLLFAPKIQQLSKFPVNFSYQQQEFNHYFRYFQTIFASSANMTIN